VSGAGAASPSSRCPGQEGEHARLEKKQHAEEVGQQEMVEDHVGGVPVSVESVEGVVGGEYGELAPGEPE
jgi:hypothetical protein